jgi:hypothetical protein
MQNSRSPRDNEKYRWTNHVVRKMRFYGLSPSRVLRVVNAPARMEEGVAPGTLAGMQTAGTKAKPWEVWVMWRREAPSSKFKIQSVKSGIQRLSTSDFGLTTGRVVIITAWRYPGTSPVRSVVPIPAGVLAELEAEGLLDSSAGEVV